MFSLRLFLQSTPWYLGSKQSRFIPASSRALEEPISPDQIASQRSRAQSSGPPSPREGEEEEEEEEDEEGEEEEGEFDEEEEEEPASAAVFPSPSFSFLSFFALGEAARSTSRACASRARAQDCT